MNNHSEAWKSSWGYRARVVLCEALKALLEFFEGAIKKITSVIER